ncbi:RDD family protein [Angustibacter peucedani]
MDEVVTGEAVLLDVRPATFASRAVSGAIDLAAELAVLITTFVVSLRLTTSLDGAAAAALSLVVFVGVAVGVPVLVETLTRGRTLGKLVMGLRAVRDDGGPIRLRHALVRGLVGFVELWVLWGVPALLASLLNDRGKRLGDLAAGTYVVRERATAQTSLMALLPPQLAPWAATADIGRLPDGLALHVRQFLGRAQGMHPQARAAMAVQLAGAVRPHVAPAPPPGTPDEPFLAAVLAERRRRDVDRLAREQHRRRQLAGVDAVDAALAQVRRP